MSRSHTQDPNHTTLSGEHAIDHYVMAHSDTEPEYLYRLWRATNIHMLHGRMASGCLQGRLLRMLVIMARPQNIVEVGTFSGYSALCLAEGLEAVWGHDRQHGHLYTFEINDEQEPFTRPWIEQSPWAHRITFSIADAITAAPATAHEHGITFDMAFIDGDKRTYIDTIESLLPVMTPGAFILADNTLWDGHVVEAEYDRDRQTVAIREFNDHVACDTRLERVMLPLRDGLTIIRKRP